MHGVGKSANLFPLLYEIRFDIATVQLDGRVRKAPGRHVQGRPIFGDIDLFPCGHGIEAISGSRHFGQIIQQIHGVTIHPLTGIVVEHATAGGTEVGQPLVGIDKMPEMVVAAIHNLGMIGQSPIQRVVMKAVVFHAISNDSVRECSLGTPYGRQPC